ncbi:MAG: aldo/keto reductase, partial [Candidatus Faecivicinus sp.]
KRLGRIRHLGFSCHGRVECLKEFLDAAAADMEFCQIQLNWLDWTLQDARAKVELLNERHIPVWVMEPVRGGRLCKLDAKDESALKALRPDESISSWGFRFLQGIPGVTMVLSGMSNLQQMQENVQTFADRRPLNEREMNTILSIADGMKSSIPCTGCRYCTDHCPMGLDIPLMMATCSELRFSPVINIAMRLEGLPSEKQPSACIGCGACAQMCPQCIDIPGVMAELSETLSKIPKWADLCKQREEAAKKVRK